MDQNVLSYTIIVEKEILKGKDVFVSYAPKLGISDFGQTIDEAVKNIKKAIILYLQTLSDLKQKYPASDNSDYFVSQIRLTSNNKFATC